MRQFDLSPLYRSTVGFDRLFNMIDQAAGLDTAPTYPPYNIERTGENAYRITLAVAGLQRGRPVARVAREHVGPFAARVNRATRTGRRRPRSSTRGSQAVRSSAGSSSQTMSR